MPPVTSDDFAELIGEVLSGVTFVCDYFQLQFKPPPTLDIYTTASVRFGAQSAAFGESAFANMLIAQIGKKVVRVDLRHQETLEIRFDDGSVIAVSLRLEDYRCAEAILLRGAKHRLLVIRADT